MMVSLMSVVSHRISGTSILARSLDVTLGLGDFISALSDVALSGDEFLYKTAQVEIKKPLRSVFLLLMHHPKIIHHRILLFLP